MDRNYTTKLNTVLQMREQQQDPVAKRNNRQR